MNRRDVLVASMFSPSVLHAQLTPSPPASANAVHSSPFGATQRLTASQGNTQEERAFNPRFVEQLLNQSADLLDRCLGERASLSDLELRKFHLDLDSEQRAIEATLAFRRKQGNVDGWEERLVRRKETFLRTARDQSTSYKNTIHGIAASSATAENVARKALADAEEAAAYAAWWESSSRMEWLQTDAPYMTEYLNRTEQLHLSYGRSLTDNSGLNLRAQVSALEKRIQRDFQDAYDRMLAALTGMRQIYGYERQHDALELKSIDGLAEINRNAISWLAGEAQQDQRRSLVVSAQASTGANLNVGMPSIPQFTVEVPAALFAGLASVRLAGLSLAILPRSLASPFVPYRAAVSIPRSARYTHRGGGEVSVDQSSVPHVVLGRVDSIGALREPEFVIGSATNTSPIGVGSSQFGVTLAPIVGVTTHNIADVLLELHVVGRPI